VTSSTVGSTREASSVRLAVEAMATRFELVLPIEAAPAGSSEEWLRAIGQEALDEIVRLESRLSRFQPSSDISWINAHAGHRSVKIEPRLFALLQRSFALSDATGGAFDVTVGPLIEAWARASEGSPLPGIDEVRTKVGWQHVRLDPRGSTIRFRRSGMQLDLGAVGKGYAVDAAIAILREQGVTSALLHGGTSSVHAIGVPPDASAWRIAWNPPKGKGRTFDLCDAALAVSAVHGRTFTVDGRTYGHVIDPRTGVPTSGRHSAAVTGPASLECDALSTALLVLGPSWIPRLRTTFPGYDAAATTAGCPSSVGEPA
jgi:FAD:protein FMN transferase